MANDAATDLVLGVGWDSVQSRNAFMAYKKVATNKSYESKLVNFYYWLDLVGEGLGASPLYKHAGTDVMLAGKDIDGNYLRDDKYFDNLINIRDIKYHDIAYFHYDFDLLYTSPHRFAYWAK